MKRVLLTLSAIGCLLLCATLLIFPGNRAWIAVTLGTGVGMPELQARVSRLEAEAFEGQALGVDDREFLVDLYPTMATGGRLSVVMSDAGRLLDHYLDGTGRPYGLEPEIFLSSRNVRGEMTALRERVGDAGCGAPGPHLSERFYMPDTRDLDSRFGLYWGTLEVTSAARSDDQCDLTWTARVPWVWPSFASLKTSSGKRRAENNVIPNLLSLTFGREHGLKIDNALGGHLVTMMLAKPFTSQATWGEAWTP